MTNKQLSSLYLPFPHLALRPPITRPESSTMLLHELIFCSTQILQRHATLI